MFLARVVFVGALFASVLFTNVLFPGGARGDLSTDKDKKASDAKPAMKRACQGGPPRFYACGILGPPCCLGDHLLLPEPEPPLDPTPEYSAQVLAQVASANPGEARAQLATMRNKKYFPRLEKHFSKYPTLAALWRAMQAEAAQPAAAPTAPAAPAPPAK